jgi:hypothetical protein
LNAATTALSGTFFLTTAVPRTRPANASKTQDFELFLSGFTRKGGTLKGIVRVAEARP